MPETIHEKHRNRTIYLENYGCTLSKSEAGLYVNSIMEEGDQLVRDPDNADLRVINTCVVISQTEKRMIKRIQELSALGEVEVTGCLPTISAHALEQPGIKLISSETFRNFYRGALDGIEIREPSIFDGIPINQGCTGSCNFCISRISRGKLLSRPPEKIVSQVKMQLERGIKEVRISSLDSAAYGKDSSVRLPGLIDRITEIDEDFLLRVGMMEPKNTGEILPALLNSYRNGKVFKFLHIPVQSGSDYILEKMNREYTSSDFVRIAWKYRTAFPGATISTDVITGYPGEGEKEFLETLEIIEKTRPNIINVTRFSPRQFTKDFMSLPEPSNITKERDKEIVELHRRISGEEFEKSVGSELSVMITEKGKGNTSVGRDIFYRPVAVPGIYDRFSKVHLDIIGSGPTYLVGQVSR